MVMNHYKRPKRFYVRTRIWYTTEPRTPVYPTAVGDCRHLRQRMAYDVPGGGAPGSTFTDRSTWTAPFNGAHHRRRVAPSRRRDQPHADEPDCGRTLFDAKAYYGAADHPYNTIRPILHEPGPIANGTFRALEGVPVAAGEVLERAALHDNATLHVAAMGFWVLLLARDDGVTGCAPMPRRRARGAPCPRSTTARRRTSTAARCRSCSRRTGRGARSTGGADRRPVLPAGRVTAKVGQRLTWRFTGVEPHSVTVANGPRGFSSNYLGHTRGSYSFTPTVPGTYRLTCLIHPTTMAQTLRRQTRS